jgi:hypothetical protein
MKRHERDQLLKEILGGDEVSEVRQASLEQGLTAIRKSRARRRALRAGTLVMLPALLAVALLVHQRPASSVTSVASVPVTRSPSAPPRPAASIKLITDEELFALFPDRSLALIGPPGHQQLVFLDQGGGKKGAQGL